jgi:hypothetical protein
MAARHRWYRPRLPTPFEAMVPWGPVLVGIGVMVGYLISTFVLPTDDPLSAESPGDAGVLAEESSTPPSPSVSPPAPAEGVGLPRGQSAIPPRESPPPPPPPPSPSPEPPPEPPPPLAGKYELEASYGDVFIGRVIITNPAPEDQDWTVTLAFPDNVGELNTFWVDDTLQPDLDREGELYVFRSAEPVDGRSSVALKVHFDRWGWDVAPTVCTVNGGDCELP